MRTVTVTLTLKTDKKARALESEDLYPFFKGEIVKIETSVAAEPAADADDKAASAKKRPSKK